MLGADWVEFDIRATADGAAIVSHEPYLPDGRALIDLIAAEVPSELPDLEQALDACQGLGINVEVKNSPAELDYDPAGRLVHTLIDTLAGRGWRDEVLVSCFDLATLNLVRELAPQLPTAWLIAQAPRPDAVIAVLTAHGHRVLHPAHDLVTAELMTACQNAGIIVQPWTVDDPARMVQLVGLGVGGICTNVPDVLVDVLNALGR